jgi:hypothetical protein
MVSRQRSCRGGVLDSRLQGATIEDEVASLNSLPVGEAAFFCRLVGNFAIAKVSGQRRSGAVDGNHHILAHVYCGLPESDKGLVLRRVIPSVQGLHIGKLEDNHPIRQPMFCL